LQNLNLQTSQYAEDPVGDGDESFDEGSSPIASNFLSNGGVTLSKSVDFSDEGLNTSHTPLPLASRQTPRERYARLGSLEFSPTTTPRQSHHTAGSEGSPSLRDSDSSSLNWSRHSVDPERDAQQESSVKGGGDVTVTSGGSGAIVRPKKKKYSFGRAVASPKRYIGTLQIVNENEGEMHAATAAADTSIEMTPSQEEEREPELEEREMKKNNFLSRTMSDTSNSSLLYGLQVGVMRHRSEEEDGGSVSRAWNTLEENEIAARNMSELIGESEDGVATVDSRGQLFFL
jgi:hypothetical protein